MASRVRGGRGSKAKGSEFERTLASYINERVGLKSRRALLSGGGRSDGGADLDGTPLIHVEAKRTEKCAPYEAMKQAEEAISRIGNGVAPVVITRRNHVETGKSLVVMRLDDWLRFYAAAMKTYEVASSASTSATQAV